MHTSSTQQTIADTSIKQLPDNSVEKKYTASFVRGPRYIAATKAPNSYQILQMLMFFSWDMLEYADMCISSCATSTKCQTHW